MFPLRCSFSLPFSPLWPKIASLPTGNMMESIRDLFVLVKVSVFAGGKRFFFYLICYASAVKTCTWKAKSQHPKMRISPHINFVLYSDQAITTEPCHTLPFPPLITTDETSSSQFAICQPPSLLLHSLPSNKRWAPFLDRVYCSQFNVNISISPRNPPNYRLASVGRCFDILGLSPSCASQGGLLCHTRSLVWCIIVTMYDILCNLHCAALTCPCSLLSQVRLKCSAWDGEAGEAGETVSASTVTDGGVEVDQVWF